MSVEEFIVIFYSLFSMVCLIVLLKTAKVSADPVVNSRNSSVITTTSYNAHF